MHNNAAGFSLPYKKLDQFIDWSNKQLINVSLDVKTWNVDFSFDANNPALSEVIRDMDKLKNLWGQGFAEPLIYVKNIRVNRSDISVMGKNSDTVKITHNGISYMFFKQSPEEVKKITQHSYAIFNIVGKANLNVYYSKVSPQIFVDDYEIKPFVNF